MKRVICLLFLMGLMGCAQSGYSPSYIISDAGEEICSVPLKEEL